MSEAGPSRDTGLLVCSVAGTILAVVTAFDTIGFASAVLPYGWHPDLDRAMTVLTFGAGFGLFVTGFAVLRQLTPDVAAEVEPGNVALSPDGHS